MMTQALNALNISSSPGEESLAEKASARKQAGRQNNGIGHVGLRATNPAASAEYYRDVLGMEIVGGSTPDHQLGATAFLSSRPDEESHEIALFADPALLTSPSGSRHSPSSDPSTHALWRRISRSSSHSTTACPSPSISTTLTAT
jgi:Glyoxalase/Bleomycin resistance protein/Dioxygenase superfamily